MSDFIIQKGASPARARLVCFHHAAGAASAYRNWRISLPQWIELAAVQLPGREQRMREPLATDLLSAASQIARAMAKLEALPTFLFGHSMGAILAYEAALLAARLGVAPAGLTVAGSPPPHIRKRKKLLHRLEDDELLAELARFDGTPPQVLAEPELLAFFLPRIRADFEMLETYPEREWEPVGCPIMILAATDDGTVHPEAVAEWNLYSSAGSEFHELNGGHFFVHEQTERVGRLLGVFIERRLVEGAALRR